MTKEDKIAKILMFDPITGQNLMIVLKLDKTGLVLSDPKMLTAPPCAIHTDHMLFLAENGSRWLWMVMRLSRSSINSLHKYRLKKLKIGTNTGKH